MFVVRNPVTGQSVTVNTLTRLSPVQDLRSYIYREFSIDSENTLVRLYARGKELIDGCTLFDYSLKEGEVIFFNLKPIVACAGVANIAVKEENLDASAISVTPMVESKYFRIGEKVDICSAENGAWYEAVVTAIVPRSIAKVDDLDDELEYHCTYESYGKSTEIANLSQIVPRIHKKLAFEGFDPSTFTKNVLVNYNFDSPGQLGDWYRGIVRSVADSKRRSYALICDLMTENSDKITVRNCKITKIDEFYEFEDRLLLSDENRKEPGGSFELRKTVQCNYCFDQPKKNCEYCKCVACKSGENGDKLLLCNECDHALHTYCLSPPLEEVPEDDFYCPDCKNDENIIVKAGEKVKLSKRQLSLPSRKSGVRWDSGNQCKGLRRSCTIVPSNFFGSIPGVQVGTTWQFQTQLAEAGVHRMVVAGIHGTAKDGAFSIVVAGGYEDDKDDGDEIFYTGSGGRDLSGNKRTAVQSKDQEFDRFNLALAMDCAAPLNPLGADAGSKWRKGKALRVVRSYKGRVKGESKFAPEKGYRYDGIYKVVKYWKEKGRSGFFVYRYLLRRDDPVPAPWTKEGKALIEKLGLDRMIMFEAAPKNKPTEANDGNPPKKIKVELIIDDKTKQYINADKVNESLWQECLSQCQYGQQAFVDFVEETFKCIICCTLMTEPITTKPCGHSFCKQCLQRSFKAQVTTCPTCRTELSEEQLSNCNKNLEKALSSIFVGYNSKN